MMPGAGLFPMMYTASRGRGMACLTQSLLCESSGLQCIEKDFDANYERELRECELGLQYEHLRIMVTD